MVDPIRQIIEAKRKKIKVYPQHVPRASEIGHPCERYLVFSITKWAERQPHKPEVEFIFDGGRLVEELAIKDFEDAGFKVYRPEPDKAIMESKPRITGHIDIRVDFGDGQIYTGEIKGLNVFDFDKLNRIEDFHASKKPWIKKYPAQLMTYLYIKGEWRGFFYLKSIPRFQPKMIWVDLDLGYMEQILQKTERVERHVAAGTVPETIAYDDTVCGFCPFIHICLPEIKRSALVIQDDPEIEDKLKRMNELKAARSEYERLDKEVKKQFQEKDRLVVGDFMITGKWVEKGAFTVPASKYWKSKIQFLGGNPNAE